MAGRKKEMPKAVTVEEPATIVEAVAEVEEKPEKKKTDSKKTTAKAELKKEMILQFAGNEYTEKEILKKIKNVWTKEMKNKIGDMKSVRIYLKPEESAAYFVVNDEISGKADL